MSQTIPEREQPTPAADPLIDEIRAIRRELSTRFGNDVFRLGQYLQEQEEAGREEREIRSPPAPGTFGRAG